MVPAAVQPGGTGVCLTSHTLTVYLPSLVQAMASRTAKPLIVVLVGSTGPRDASGQQEYTNREQRCRQLLPMQLNHLPVNLSLSQVHGGPLDVSELHDSPRVAAMLTSKGAAPPWGPAWQVCLWESDLLARRRKGKLHRQLYNRISSCCSMVSRRRRRGCG